MEQNNEFIAERRGKIGTACSLTFNCLERYCKAVNAFRKKENEINASDAYNQRYKEVLILQEAEKLRTAAYSEHSAIMSQLGVIEEAARDMEEYLDLGPGELQGSLMVVQTVGDRLPIQSRSTILEKFRGQHQSLLLLKEAFEKADMSSTSFEGLLFSVESRMDELEDLADHLIMQEGSDLLRVSRFARRLEAFATDMGVTLSADWRAFDGLQDAFLKELANVTGLVDE